MAYLDFTNGLLYVYPTSVPNDGATVGQGYQNAAFLCLGKTTEVWSHSTKSGVVFSCDGNKHITVSKDGLQPVNYTASDGLYVLLGIDYTYSNIVLCAFWHGSSQYKSSGVLHYNWIGENGETTGAYPTLTDFINAVTYEGRKIWWYINISGNSGTLSWFDNAFPYSEYFNTHFKTSSEYWDLNSTYESILLGELITIESYNVTYDLSNCTGDSGNPSLIPMNATVTNLSFTPDSGYAFNSGSCWIDGDGYPSGTPVDFAFDPEIGGLRIGPISSDIIVHVHSFIDPYNNPDNPDLIDGESDIPNADIISVPSLPGIGAVSSGMIGLFNPSASQMQLLADYMWTDFGGTGSTTEDILKEIVQAIKRSISNPLDYVIGLNIIPSQGLSVGSSTSVRFGFVNSNVSMPRLTSQYFTVDCGSLSFDKLCGDTFLDYAPYSKFSLYLPYIGVKEMDANDFVGHTISILYHGDVVTGGVTAYILKDGSVMYQYSGCCALTIPLNADSWGNTISGAIQIATAIIGGAALSSAGSGFAAKRAGVMAATGAANIASNPSLLSPQVMRSGAISGGAGCMASQKPFVIREAVRFHTTEGFNAITGYPSYYYRALSSMHGFTSVLDVHLHGIPGTHQELAEIEDLLKEGVIL